MRRESKMSLFQVMSDPKVLQLISDVEFLKRDRSRKRKNLTAFGLTSEDIEISIFSELERLDYIEDSGIKPLTIIARTSERLKLQPITSESYNALIDIIDMIAIIVLKAALKEENEVVRTFYALLFFDLYDLRFKISLKEQYLSLNVLSMDGQVLDENQRTFFFSYFRSLIDILEEYFRSDEEGTTINFILDYLQALYNLYS